MNISILIIKNRISYSLAINIEQLKQFLLSLGIQPNIEIKDTDFELKLKDFGIKGFWGLDGIKQTLRESGIVKPLAYDIVYFCYDQREKESNVASWTYPSDLNGAAFCEITYRPTIIKDNGFVMIHETIHAFGRLLTWKGIYIADTLDIDNNNDRMINLYKPYLDIMLADYSIQKKIWFLTSLLNFLKSMLPQKKQEEKEKIKNIIRRIAIEEGIDADKAIQVAIKESSLNPLAVNINNDRRKTKDRGLWQINNFWHPEISDECCYDPECSTRFFCKRVKKGYEKEWYGAKGIFY